MDSSPGFSAMKKFNLPLAVLGVAVFLLTASRLGWRTFGSRLKKSVGPFC